MNNRIYIIIIIILTLALIHTCDRESIVKSEIKYDTIIDTRTKIDTVYQLRNIIREGKPTIIKDWIVKRGDTIKIIDTVNIHDTILTIDRGVVMVDSDTTINRTETIVKTVRDPIQIYAGPILHNNNLQVGVDLSLGERLMINGGLGINNYSVGIKYRIK
jgi:hypothetical protein